MWPCDRAPAVSTGGPYVQLSSCCRSSSWSPARLLLTEGNTEHVNDLWPPSGPTSSSWRNQRFFFFFTVFIKLLRCLWHIVNFRLSVTLFKPDQSTQQWRIWWVKNLFWIFRQFSQTQLKRWLNQFTRFNNPKLNFSVAEGMRGGLWAALLLRWSFHNLTMLPMTRHTWCQHRMTQADLCLFWSGHGFRKHTCCPSPVCLSLLLKPSRYHHLWGPPAELGPSYLPIASIYSALKAVMFTIFIAILIADIIPQLGCFSQQFKTCWQQQQAAERQRGISLFSEHSSFIYLHLHSPAPQELMKMLFSLQSDKGCACWPACVQHIWQQVTMWSLMRV